MRLRSFFMLPPLWIGTLSLGIFLLVPGAVKLLAYSGDLFLGGQFWRLFTFPFVHVGSSHLIENLVVLLLTSYLAYELELTWKQFGIVFIASSFMLAMTNLFILSTLLIAGASVGIYGVLGSSTLKGSNFIPRYILIPVIGVSAFVKIGIELFARGVLTSMTVTQGIYHFMGFIYGMVLFYLLYKIRWTSQAKVPVLRRMG